jgi:hypothetical protein
LVYVILRRCHNLGENAWAQANAAKKIKKIEETNQEACLFFFQPAESAAMMPYGLGLDMDGIFAAVVACRHLLDELMHLFWGHSGRYDPSHLATMNAMVAFRFIDSHDGVLGLVLAISVTQVQQISIVKAIANRPLVVGHGLYQIVLAFQLLEGEYAVGMNHNLHLSI